MKHMSSIIENKLTLEMCTISSDQYIVLLIRSPPPVTTPPTSPHIYAWRQTYCPKHLRLWSKVPVCVNLRSLPRMSYTGRSRIGFHR